MRCYRVRPHNKTAFDWRLYASRCESLKWLRHNRIHVDTIVSTKDGFSETVHWQVISALCQKLINASKVNNIDGYKQLILPGCVNALLARQLVDCAYGEQPILDGDRLQDLFKLAIDYNISHAIKICLDHAKKLLTINNCVKLYLISLEHKHHTLRRACYSMLRSNFKLLVQVNPDFHLLSCEQLKQLLQDNHLKLDEDEEFAWLAIRRWMTKHPLSQVEASNILNQMLAPLIQLPIDPPAEPISTSRPLTSNLISTCSPIVPISCSDFVLSSQNRKYSWASNFVKSERPLEKLDESDALAELLKCLRFMRFRSLNAFNAILACDLIRGNELLTNLVLLMKLRYAIRKKLPPDEAQLDMISADLVDKIRLSETNKVQRFMDFIFKVIMCQWQGVQERFVHRPSNNRTAKDLEKKEEKFKQEVEISSEYFEQLDENCLERAVIPRVPKSIGLLIGGWQEGSVRSTMLAYDFVYDKWFKLNLKLPEPRAFHAACVSAETGQLYIYGGTDGKRILNSVIRFDPTQDILAESGSCKTQQKKCSPKQSRPIKNDSTLNYKFHYVCSMSDRRCHLSGLFHSDGRLYALGGHNGTQRLRSCEWLDFKSNQWHTIAEMIIPRSDASACSHGNKIFIAGGQIGEHFIQSSVEFYKPSDNTWTLATPMIVPRMSFKLISYKNHLLAIGGTNGLYGGDEVASVTRTVERYDTNQASWSICSPMNQKRSSFGIMNIENKLIVAGGHSGRRRVKCCEQLKIGQVQMHAQTSNLLGQRYFNVRRSQSFVENNNSVTSLQRRNSIATSRLTFEEGNVRVPDRQIGAINNQISRNTMRWFSRASLPSKRSGFSICVLNRLKNAQEFTYYGSLTGAKLVRQGKPTVIKQPSRWSRFKIIKRRKLIKNLKIALVVIIIVLIV